jgi:hypothetical protein
MSITINKAATSMTVTGGTAQAFEKGPADVKNGANYIDTGETDFTIQSNLTCRSRSHQVQSDGTYSKAKRFLTAVKPKKRADGTVAFNLVRIEIEFDPETTAAERLDLELSAAQLLTDSELASFRAYGTIPA